MHIHSSRQKEETRLGSGRDRDLFTLETGRAVVAAASDSYLGSRYSSYLTVASTIESKPFVEMIPNGSTT